MPVTEMGQGSHKGKGAVIPPKRELLLLAAKRLLNRQAIRHLTKMLDRLYSADVAHIIQQLDTPEEKRTIFDCLADDARRGEVLSELDESSREQLVKTLSPSRTAGMLRELGSDDIADVLGSVSEEQRAQILSLMKQEDSSEIKELLQYPEGTAGSIMTPEVFALHEEATVGEAIRRLQEAEEAETVFYVYVTDSENRLTGVFSLRRLLTVPPSTPLHRIMTRNVISVKPGTDQEEVAQLVAAYNLLAIPVVDDEGRLLGIITVDDVVDVIREEATEDMLKMAGAPDEEAFLHSSIPRAAWVRFPWLFTNLLGTFVSGSILWYFRFTLQEVVALVSFIPVIAAMSGNVGLQTSMLVIRGMALGQIGSRDLRRVWLHELSIGLILGVSCGLLVMGVGWFWHQDMTLGLVVGSALVLAFSVSTSVAAVLPLLLNRLDIDPAVVAGPFVSTMMDMIGITIYLTLATLLLGSLG